MYDDYHWGLYLLLLPAEWVVQADSWCPESTEDLIQVSPIAYTMFFNWPVSPNQNKNPN